MSKSNVFVMIMVAFITAVLHNFTLAVIIGVIIAVLEFSGDNAKRIMARKFVDELGVKHYEMY